MGKMLNIYIHYILYISYMNNNDDCIISFTENKFVRLKMQTIQPIEPNFIF
ncbi:hypothetical protein DsansV1_C29g0212461 [Dioscorea sansibarensis]